MPQISLPHPDVKHMLLHALLGNGVIKTSELPPSLHQLSAAYLFCDIKVNVVATKRLYLL